MLSQVDETNAWLFHDANGSSSGMLHWSEDLQLPMDKASALFTGVDADGLMEKVNEDKLARDVDDLSAIFEELEGGGDIPLPFDNADENVAVEEEKRDAAAEGEAWIEDLEKDAVNVDELSAVFDVLAAEQAVVVEAAENVIDVTSDSDEADDDEDMDDAEDYEDETDDETERRRIISVQIVPAPPAWITMAPLDPRSCIRTPVFKNLDSRIPRVEIPRMDLAFGAPADRQVKVGAVVGAPLRAPSPQVSPKPCEQKKASCESKYRHDPATCWICKSDKSPYKKYALHRYLEKRHRRNWKRGPRYSGRSHVATSRVREGGRFVCTAQWV